MESRQELERVVSPFYCRLALILCQQARELLNDPLSCTQASEICRFISTLCSKNRCTQCLEESSLCISVSKRCVAPGDLEEAKSVCDRARRLCPKSFTINAS